MVKILKSVGKHATNDIHDVAAVQMALKKAKPVKVGCPWYNGPIDGKISHALTNAIIEFQMEHCIRETGKIDPISPTRTAINRALNANWCGVRGLEGTTCLYVPGPYPGFNALTQTKRKAPFPDDEVTGLVRLMANVQKEFDLTLTCSNDNITQDGRFATTLAINYDQFIDNATATLLPKGKVPNAACNIIHKYVKSIAEWNEGSANDLNVTSKRQLQCLKNAKQPSAAYLKEIGIPMPTDPMQKQLVAAAENAGTINNPTQAGKDLEVIKEAATGANDQVAKKVKISTAITPPANDNDQYILYLVARTPGSIDSENIESTFGHVFIGGQSPSGPTKARGFYPKPKDPLWQSWDLADYPDEVSGEVRDDLPSLTSALGGERSFAYYSMIVTKTQYDSTFSFIRNYANNNDYALLKNNCIDAAFAALRTAGVKTPFANIPLNTPKILYRSILTRNHQERLK